MLQYNYLRDGVSLILGGTLKVDLPNSGKLSGIMLKVNSTQVSNHGLTGGKWRFLDYLTQIRVIADGSEIITDMTPKMMQAASFFDHGDVPPSAWRNYASAGTWDTIPIYFGRKFGDRELGLDLSKFNSVQLEITNDATSTQFADSLTAQIATLQFHSEINPPTFVGHLRKEEWRKYTTVQDQWQYLELPVEGKLRRVLLQCIPDKTTGLDDTRYDNQADDIRLSVKTGALEVIRAGMDDIVRLNAMRYGCAVVPLMGPDWNADAAHEIGLGYWLGMGGIAGMHSGAAASVIQTLTIGDTGGTPRMESRDSENTMLIKGLSPQYTEPIFQSEPDEPSMYLDTRSLATVGLDIHTRNAAASADGTNRIVLERLVT